MTKRSDTISYQLIIIIILFSLTTIFGCGDNWSFDLFGGDSVNGDDGNDNNGDDDPVEFPAAVFSASIGGNKIDEPVELFSSFDNGSDITPLTGEISEGGEVDEFEDVFKVSPDGTLVAYRTDQNNSRIELFVVPVEGGTKIRISEFDDADVTEFDWSPDGKRIAYLAKDEIDDRVELYTNLAEGGENRKVSGSLPPGGTVDAFEWSPDSEWLAYRADQNNVDEFELFTTPPTKSDPVKVSETVEPNNGDVAKFSWSPSCPCSSSSLRIAYLSDQRSAGLFELFTSLPTGSDNVSISDGDSVQDFAWAPDSTRIAYRADQDSNEIFELFTVEPDGSDELRISGDLTNGGDVTDFVWSPDSGFIAYRANQDSADEFELYVTTPDGRLSDTIVSGRPMAGDVDPFFEWSPDSSRVAYRADQRFVGVIELFTSTPDGQPNDRVSGDLSNGRDVEEFIWAPDSSGIGYIADQNIDEVFELFASAPDGDGEPANLSGSFAEDGDVLFFEWVAE